jgi:DegV family protein with EDD domain
VTDSTADLTLEQLDELGVEMIPLQVTIGGEDYLDWVEIGPERFLDKLTQVEELPTTSQPPIGKFIEVYQKLAKEYEAIVSLHFSSQFSGTYETAQLAAKQVEEGTTGVEIEVIDSRLVTGPLGVMVEEVAKKIQKTEQIEEVKDFISDLRQRITLYFTIDELDYLEKGGRIGKASAFLGNLFSVRPLLTLEDGEITPCKKVRGEKRLYRDLSRLTGEALSGSEGEKLVILYGKYRDKAQKLKAKLTAEYNWETVRMRRFGAIVGSHIGPTPFGAVILR